LKNMRSEKINNKVLIVEDNNGVQNLYREILRRNGYQPTIKIDVSSALEAVEKEEFDLVILDLQLPDENGIAFLEKMTGIDKNLPPVVVCTGMASIENAVDAIKKGASDFITKPFTIEGLISTIERNIKISQITGKISDIEMVRLILELNRIIISITDTEELSTRVIDLVYNFIRPDIALFYLKEEDTERFFLRRVKGRLSNFTPLLVLSASDIKGFEKGTIDIARRTDDGFFEVNLYGKKDIVGILRLYSNERSMDNRELKFLSVLGTQIGIAIENASLLQQLKESYISAIRSLVNSLEARDAYTKGHSEQVAYYSVAIGKVLGLDSHALESLRNAGYLHDIGKLGIRDEIIQKESSLSEKEFEIIKRHPIITKEILKPLRIRKEEMDACFFHHEMINGKGYPYGLKGEQIPLMARILAVADSLSAMISERPYRKKMKIDEAIKELEKNAGEQFDENIVRALISVLKNSKTL